MAHIVVIEDSLVSGLYPVTLTRRASQITLGGVSLEDCLSLLFKAEDISFKESSKEEPAWRVDSNTIYLNSRLVPSVAIVKEVISHALKEKTSVKKYPMLTFPWDIVRYHLAYCDETIGYLSSVKKPFKGHKKVFVGAGSSIDPYTVFDTTKGPIVLDKKVSTEAYAVLRGPLYIGSDSTIKAGAVIGPKVVAGEHVKLGGEVAESVIESFSNKAHYGFLGHSYVGSWVNIGGGTSNSDLKNTYGSIRVKIGKKKRDTEMQFFGTVIGDYAKTAVNTAIYTGKLVGVASACYGIIAENVPSFSHATPKGLYEFTLDAALNMQQRMFDRRNKEATKEDKEILKTVFDKTKKERKDFGVKKKQVEF